MAIWFIKHEKSELQEVKNVLLNSQWQWVLLGLGLAFIYIIMHGFMYKSAFAAVGSKTQLTDAVVLFLKWNWQLDACPMDGRGLAINENGIVSAAWSETVMCVGEDDKTVKFKLI